MNPKRKTTSTPIALATRCLAFVGIGLLRVISIPVGIVLWVVDLLPRRHRQRPHYTLRQTDQYHRHIYRHDTDDISLGRMTLVFIAAVLMMIWILFL